MNDGNIFVGIDFHKRYSVISAQDSQGGRLLEARVEGNTPDGFKRVFPQVPGPCKVAMEACWTWGKLHDSLEDIPEIEEILPRRPSGSSSELKALIRKLTPCPLLPR